MRPKACTPLFSPEALVGTACPLQIVILGPGPCTKKRDAFRAPLDQVKVFSTSGVAAASSSAAPTTMKASSLAAVEASATTMGAATAGTATHTSLCHCRPRVESAAFRARSGVDAVCIGMAGCVVLAGSPGPNVRGVKFVMEMSAIERSTVDESGGIESPAERAIENAVQWDEGVCGEPWVPTPAAPTPAPSRTPEAGPVTAVSDQDPRLVHVGLGQIIGSQAAPTIQIVTAQGLLIELLGLVWRILRQAQFVSTFQFYLLVAVFHTGFAIEDPHLILLQIKIVKSRLHDSDGSIAFGYQKIVLRINLVYFHQDVALRQLYFRIAKAGSDQAHRCLVSLAQEHAGSQQNFSFPYFRTKRLADFDSSFANRVVVDRLVSNIDLPLDII